MDTEKQKILEDVNRAIIQFRGIYSIWANEHGITYNEMLVLYTRVRLLYAETDLRTISPSETDDS